MDNLKEAVERLSKLKKGIPFKVVYGSSDGGITWCRDEQLIISTFLDMYNELPKEPLERLSRPGEYPPDMHEIPLGFLQDKTELLNHFLTKMGIK